MSSAGLATPFAGLATPFIAARIILGSGARNREFAERSGQRERPVLPREVFAGTPPLALSVLRSDLCAQLAPLNAYGPTPLSAAIADALIAITRRWRRWQE
jgi:hypothetical protein